MILAVSSRHHAAKARFSDSFHVSLPHAIAWEMNANAWSTTIQNDILRQRDTSVSGLLRGQHFEVGKRGAGGHGHQCLKANEDFLVVGAYPRN